ncbi:hypothetical protein GIB67_002315 [Kingdonia uniflora]|uniref:Uncharacterized protein n=1 Tax=Kingdonia uniflora TaxID=39325 RepID=A0A7J7KXB8_9MAGN|nr:hypothetical protein GIB67_002315 [Kingdonia uniflora]
MKDTGMRECPNFFPVSIISKLGLDTFVISPSVKHDLKVSLDDTKREYYTIGVYPKLAIGDRAQLPILNNGTECTRITSLSAWSMKKATSNQDRQQSIKELKEKEDESKGMKKELKVRTKQASEQIYKHVEGAWTKAEATAKKVVSFGSARAYVGCEFSGCCDYKVGNGETASTCLVDNYIRVVRDALNAKRYEMDSVQPVINRMKNARSIDDMLASDREGSGDWEEYVEEDEDACYGEGLETKEIIKFKKIYSIPGDERLEEYQYEMMDHEIPFDVSTGGRYTDEPLLVSGNYEFNQKDLGEPQKRKAFHLALKESRKKAEVEEELYKIKSGFFGRIDNLAIDKDQLSDIFQEAGLKRSRTKGSKVSVIGGKISSKNKRAANGSLPLNNPSLKGYNTSTEIDVMVGQSFVKQEKMEGKRGSTSVAESEKNVLTKMTTGGSSKKKFVEEFDAELQKTMESYSIEADVLKKAMGEEMGRVEGSGELANRLAAYKNIEKELTAENANLNATLNRYKLEANKAKEAELAETKKILEIEKKKALAAQKAVFEKDVADVRRSMELEQNNLLVKVKAWVNKEKLLKVP